MALNKLVFRLSIIIVLLFCVRVLGKLDLRLLVFFFVLILLLHDDTVKLVEIVNFFIRCNLSSQFPVYWLFRGLLTQICLRNNYDG